MSAILMFPATQIDSLSALTQVFVRAFINDPGTQYICQHRRAGYESRLYSWFYATTRLHTANQQPILTLMVDGEYSAGALLTAPNATLRISSMERWLWDGWQKAGIISLWRTLAHLRHLAQYQPKAPHIRLEFLAVEPHQQGKGYGRDLLEAIHTLSEQDPQSTGVWLETANPNNIPLYERFGYHITGTRHLSPSIETMMMFRPNRGGRN
jgi:ribosomal protein S18 acetylase RimI-like enzyme